MVQILEDRAMIGRTWPLSDGGRASASLPTAVLAAEFALADAQRVCSGLPKHRAEPTDAAPVKGPERLDR